MMWLKNIKYVCFVSLFFWNPVQALVNSNFPPGCEVSGFSFHQGQLIVNETGQQTFYLIQNRADKQIELQRIETREVFMSPSMIARIAPSNWAALASDIQHLNFQCFSRELDPANTPVANNAANQQAHENSVQVDCATVLDICQYPRVKFALSNMGSYWVSTNKSQADAIQEATRKGIYLRW